METDLHLRDIRLLNRLFTPKTNLILRYDSVKRIESEKDIEIVTMVVLKHKTPNLIQ